MHLSLESDGSLVSIERIITPEFRIIITTNQDSRQFDNAKDFSKTLVELFGIPNRSLPTKDGGVSPTYSDFLVPMFWMD